MRVVRALQTFQGGLWVSNSLSGRRSQLDEASTVRHPAHLIRIGRSQRVFANEGQRRPAVQ